jgi:hypothetical protein
MAVFNITYEDSVIRIYGEGLNEIGNAMINVQLCNKERIDLVGGFHKILLRNGKYLVADPVGLRGSDESDNYKWFVKSAILRKQSLHMNTAWEPAYYIIENGKPDSSNFTDRSNLIVVPDKYVAADLKSKYNIPRKVLILPLLDTIHRVFPIFTGLTLQRVCATIEGRFRNWMDNKFSVMAYLFDKIKTKLNELSQDEACSISELYICNFENTFRYSASEIPRQPDQERVSLKYLANVKMYVKSSIFGTENYGDILWHLSDIRDRETFNKQNPQPRYNGVFAITDDDQEISLKGDNIDYVRLVLFPEMRIDRDVIPYGSTVGMLADGVLEFRGPLFDNTSKRDEIHLYALFNEFFNNALTTNYNPVEGFRMLPSATECNSSLIEEIKRVLLDVRSE